LATLEAAALTECGDLYVGGEAALEARALVRCGNLYVGGSLHAPALKTVNGQPYRQEG